MAKDDIFQVTTTFGIDIEGRWIEYHAGELVDADDPAYKRVPQHFGPAEFKHRAPAKVEKASVEKPVEQATAAPGEKRGKAITTDSFKGR